MPLISGITLGEVSFVTFGRFSAISKILSKILII